jgi:hypothetical protein
MAEDKTQRSRDLARAALLRERIVGALKATQEPMKVADLCSMSGIVELYHQRMLSGKIEVQLRSLERAQVVKRAGKHGATLWEFNRDRREEVQESPAAVVAASGKLQELQIEVNKIDSSIAFTLNGVRITVKVI